MLLERVVLMFVFGLMCLKSIGYWWSSEYFNSWVFGEYSGVLGGSLCVFRNREAM